MARKQDRCATKGCRRKPAADGMCAKCAAGTEPVKFPDPEDAARRLSQVELLKLGKAGAELEKSLLHLRIFKYELMEVRQQAEQQLREKLEQMEQERKVRAEQLQYARKQYDELTLDLSQKHGVADPKKMVVDTETGLIHEADSI